MITNAKSWGQSPTPIMGTIPTIPVQNKILAIHFCMIVGVNFESRVYTKYMSLRNSEQQSVPRSRTQRYSQSAIHSYGQHLESIHQSLILIILMCLYFFSVNTSIIYRA